MAVLRNYTLQDLFQNLAGSINANTDTSTQFEVIDNFVNDSESLILNGSLTPPSFSTSTNYPVNVLGDYPVVYWRLAEAAATGSAFDSNQNLFSIYPRLTSTSMSGVTQGASSFLADSVSAQFSNASSSNIVFPNNASLQITGDITVEFWINFSSFQTASGTYSLITKDVTAGGGVGEFEIYMFNNAGSGSIAWNQNGGFTASAVGSLSLSTWYHIAIVRDGTAKTIKFYVNGTQVGLQNYTTPPSTTTGTVVIGASGAFQTAGYSMTEVAIYRKPLTATQVANRRSWGIAADALATAYGGAASFYSAFPYPLLGAPTSEAYGSGTTWGTFVWK